MTQRKPVAAASDPGPGNYLFIDNARFVAVLFIVLRHTELFGSESSLSTLERCIIQFRSFGVLIFFVISGFLMESRLGRAGVTRRAYWLGRVDRIGKPWLIWLSVYVALDLLKLLGLHKIEIAAIPEQVFHSLFFSSYWYVDVLFVSLIILLPLRRYWPQLAFGIFLLVISLVHAANQYLRWFPHAHTIAFFAYLFYVWVGTQLFRTFSVTRACLDRVPSWVVAIAFLMGYGLTLVENRYLGDLGYTQVLNPLKLSDQIYALLALVVMIKLSVRLVPSFINVRRESFGIYLLHPIVHSIGRGAVDLGLGLPVQGRHLSFFGRLPELIHNPLLRVALWFLWFGLVYSGSLLLAKAICRTRWSWVVGVELARAA